MSFPRRNVAPVREGAGMKEGGWFVIPAEAGIHKSHEAILCLHIGE